MTDSLHIRTWNQEDILFAKRMTDIEEWGNTIEDFHRLCKIQPDGCFVGLKGDQRVGIITAMLFGSYGFLGSLIVPAAERGKGLGEKLMRHAISFLEAQGATTIELDGVMEAIPLYRRIGFTDKHQSLRLFRRAGELHSRSRAGRDGVEFRLLKKDDIPTVIELDQKLTGLNRGKALEALIEEFPKFSYGAFDFHEGLSGYLVVRPLNPSLAFVGPVVATDNALGIDLMSLVLSLHSDRELRIGVLAPARHVVHWLLRQGFERHPPCLRMSYGEPLKYETYIAGILSPEKC